MTKHQRYLAGQVRRDLKKKMVFVAGPRQVGKTTLARSLPGAAAGYLNWDVVEHRERFLRRELPTGRLWIFDEIHKYRAWRGYLKGLFDKGLRYLKARFPGCDAWQIHMNGAKDFQSPEGIRVAPALALLDTLI